MKRYSFSSVMLWVGLLFIYLPMLILVLYSFNASRLVTVWGGWSVKWYVGLLDNTQLMNSVMRSLEIACYTAIAAVALGTLAAFVLTRVTRFKGRTLFGGLVTAPLVMPEVITGLSLLLLFVAMAQLIGWPAERGILTIWIAHTTFCTAYVSVVVSSRLRELDLSIEEAAMDLGARPWKVFFLITIPMIAPSLGAGGMMSFALSLDDLVLASFVSGPGSTTLPMEVFSAVRLARTLLIAEPERCHHVLCVGVDVLPAGAPREILYNVISDGACASSSWRRRRARHQAIPNPTVPISRTLAAPKSRPSATPPNASSIKTPSLTAPAICTAARPPPAWACRSGNHAWYPGVRFASSTARNPCKPRLTSGRSPRSCAKPDGPTTGRSPP